LVIELTEEVNVLERMDSVFLSDDDINNPFRKASVISDSYKQCLLDLLI